MCVVYDSGKDRTIDRHGDHALCSCRPGNDKKVRHDKLVREIGKEAQAAGKTASYEMEFGDLKAGDVVIGGLASSGKDIAMDVTITHGTKTSKNYPLVPGAIDHDLESAMQGKNNRYKEVVENGGNSNTTFLPVVSNHFGGFHDSCVATLKKIGLAAAKKHRVRNPTPVHFMRRLSVLIQNANADAIYRRLPGDTVLRRRYHGGYADSRLNARTASAWDSGG
jgi:hypothetical protein